MNIIVAVDQNWGIGKNGNLLVKIPLDQQFFREMTKVKIIVLGRKTLLTFPNGLPLIGRTNIILTRDKSFRIKGGICVNSIEEALKELEKYQKEDIFIVGGESIYRQFLPYCDIAHITKIDYSYQADAYFPNLDENEEWEIVRDSEEQTYFDLEYVFLEYKRKQKGILY